MISYGKSEAQGPNGNTLFLEVTIISKGLFIPSVEREAIPARIDI